MILTRCVRGVKFMLFLFSKKFDNFEYLLIRYNLNKLDKI
jgi:hypothetical protein